jgi:D-alanyl-lipoteichoic acid acyltransferase DltB (MBOAT superfamily)
MKAYLIFIALGVAAIVAAVYYDSYDYYDKKETTMVALATIVALPITVGFFMFIFNSLFFRPLEEHKNWIVKNGIFSDEKNEESSSTNIVGRDNLSSYSVADEMLKWNDLLEKELISKEEFEKAKNKLMNGEKYNV